MIFRLISSQLGSPSPDYGSHIIMSISGIFFTYINPHIISFLSPILISGARNHIDHIHNISGRIYMCCRQQPGTNWLVARGALCPLWGDAPDWFNLGHNPVSMRRSDISLLNIDLPSMVPEQQVQTSNIISIDKYNPFRSIHQTHINTSNATLCSNISRMPNEHAFSLTWYKMTTHAGTLNNNYRPIHIPLHWKQGNLVARDLPPTGSEANTTSPPYHPGTLMVSSIQHRPDSSIDSNYVHVSLIEIKAELVIEMKKLIKINLNKFILCVCSSVTDIDTSLTFIEHIQFAVYCTYFNIEKYSEVYLSYIS